MQGNDNSVIFRKNASQNLMNAPQWQPPPKCSSPKNWHPGCLGLTLAVILFMITCVADFVRFGDEGTVDDVEWSGTANSRWTALAGLGVTMIFYWIESLALCNIRNILWKICSVPSCSEMLQTIRQNPPSVHFRVDCFHYESREIRLENKDGSSFVDSIRSRVSSYSETDTFRYAEWYDESDRLIELREYAVVKLHLKKSIHFCDVDTEKAVREQRAALEKKCRFQDDYQDSDTWFVVPGFAEEYTCVSDPRAKPWWCNVWTYVIASIFFFSWPFRILYEANFGELTFTCRKFVSIKDGNQGLKVRDAPSGGDL